VLGLGRRFASLDDLLDHVLVHRLVHETLLDGLSPKVSLDPGFDGGRELGSRDAGVGGAEDPVNKKRGVVSVLIRNE
jgi:hypothetical protein